MRKNKGFTLVELIIGMLVSSILMLVVGIISIAGHTSYEKLRKESEVYNDAYSGINLIQRSVHRAINLKIVEDGADSTITADNFTFRVDGDSLVCDVDIDSDGTVDRTDIIISGVEGLSFELGGSVDNLVKITLTGTKDKVLFNVSASALRRNG